MKTKILLSVMLIALLGQLSLAEARPPMRTKAARAAEISGMMRLAMHQRTPMARGPVSRLIARAHRERDPALHKMAVMSLLKTKMPLLRDQKKAILKMVRSPTRGLLPKAPPMPKKGPIEVRHYSMSGFMDTDLKRMEQAGFKVKKTSNGAEATRGRVHVLVRQTHKDILRDLHDSKVNMIVYNGHSQIGGTVEQALLAPSMKQPRGRKLIALFQCVGTQTLPLLKTRAPMADVITSNVPLYVAETPGLMRSLYDGIDKKENYHQLRRRMDKASWGKGRLVFPNQMASLQHTDFDMNGTLDAIQKAGTIQVLNRKERRVAKSLMSGVHYLRTMNPYYAEKTPGAVFKLNQAKIPVVSRGISPAGGAGVAKSVTHIVDRKVNNQRRFEVSVNPQYKTAPRHFVGASAVFELQMHLQKTLAGKNDQRAKVRALAFTGEYLELIPRNQKKAQQALNRVTKMNGLPQLDFWAVKNAIRGDHVIGEKQVDRLQQVVNRASARPRPTP